MIIAAGMLAPTETTPEMIAHAKAFAALRGQFKKGIEVYRETYEDGANCEAAEQEAKEKGVAKHEAKQLLLAEYKKNRDIKVRCTDLP